MVITKSISRFARNTVTLLKTVRELKSLGIDVFFEEQNIHSVSSEGELMLTILASFAQEESLSASENQKWRIKRNFEQGRPWSGKLFGYRLVKGTFILLPDEAAIVKRVFNEYLSGKGTEAIANGLNADGLTNRGGKWYPSVIAHMLRNVDYTGNLLLQKTYREDHLTKRTLKNDGVLPRYYVENAHEAIIDSYTFEAVQKETERRQAAYRHEHTGSEKYAFTGMIICAICGRKYKRKKTHAGPVWICPTFNSAGKAVCPSKQIPDETLRELTAGVDLDTVERMTAENGNVIRVCFQDGMERTLIWKDRSRADSWTDDMKLKAKAAAEKRYKKNGER
ncbi:MAG: recombinase family protein [Clostridia bacterium]|nr:recombinase family protein [Clostridia bacterium]